MLTFLIAVSSNAAPLFVDVSAEAGLPDAGSERGIAWADFDRDGDQDLFVAVLGGQDRLFRNQGDKTFLDVSVAAGLAGVTMSVAPAWGDFDADGDLDLYVGRSDVNSLYRNEGDGTFTDIAGEVGLTAPGVSWGSGLSASWSDFDDDGDPDLFVTVQNGSNCLYRNDGNGVFADIAGQALVRAMATASGHCGVMPTMTAILISSAQPMARPISYS